MRRYTGAERRRWRAELEWAAARRLLDHLREDGEDVEISGTRPDEVSSERPDVDFEFRYEGRAVGVEVTQLIPAARSHYEVAAIQRHLQETVGPMVRDQQLGLVLVDLTFGDLPPTAGIERDLTAFIPALLAALDLLTAEEPRVRVAFELGAGTFRRAEVRRLDDSDHRLTFITGANEWGGPIRPMAEQFLDNLLSTKPAQTAAWEEAWIVIHDRIGLVGPEDILDVLSGHTHDLPSNWTRMYLLPAADGVPITDLMAELSDDIS